MENASKALIIAGAILISILLISVGILVMRSADGVVSQGASSMNKQEKDIFNAQFTNYAGEQRGTIVKQLLNDIISSNATHEEQVAVSGLGTDPAALLSTVRTSSKYNITMSMTDGIVSEINITQAGGSSTGGSGTTTP